MRLVDRKAMESEVEDFAALSKFDDDGNLI